MQLSLVIEQSFIAIVTKLAVSDSNEAKTQSSISDF